MTKICIYIRNYKQKTHSNGYSYSTLYKTTKKGYLNTNYTIQISDSSKPFTILFFLFNSKYAHPPPIHTENINMIQPQIIIHITEIIAIVNGVGILSFNLIADFEYDSLLSPSFKYILSKLMALASMYYYLIKS